MRALVEFHSSMGGFIMELPILQALRDSGRLTWVEVVVHTPCDALLEGYDWVNRIHVRDRGLTGRFRPFVNSRLKPFDLRLYLRQRGGIDLGALFVRARKTFGVESLDASLRNRGAVAHKFSILKPVLGNDTPAEPPVGICLAPRRTDDALRKAGFGESDRILSIGPGAGRPDKVWPADRFVELIHILEGSFDRIALVGSPSEAGLCDAIARETRATSLAGRLEVAETAALLGKADLHIGNDSALAHLAAAQECRAVAIGPRFEYFAPWHGYSVPGELPAISVSDVLSVLTDHRLLSRESPG